MSFYDSSDDLFDDNDDDCLIIEEKEPKIDRIFLKKGPNGYIVEKDKKKVSSQCRVFPDLSNQSDYSAKNCNQDSFIDSTTTVENVEEAEFILPNSPNSNETELFSKNFVWNSQELDDSQLLTQVDSFDNGIDSSTLDPIILSRAIGGGYFVKDCFLGEKNVSGLEALSKGCSVENKLSYPDLQHEEPILDKLYSSLCSFSQATTITVNSQDLDMNSVDMECRDENLKTNILDDSDDDDLIFKKTDVSKNLDENLRNEEVLDNRSLEGNEVLDNGNFKKKELNDGSLVVINRSNSDVIAIGYD